MKLKPFIVFLVSILSFKNAVAQSFVEQPLLSKTSYFRLGGSQQSFLSSAFPMSDRHYPMILGELRKHDENAAVKVDLQARWAITKSALSTVNIRELFYHHQSDESSIKVGRVLWDWNFIEDEFQLGIWEPLYKAEPLRRTRQGLTGLFWATEKPDNNVLFFASPIFIPHQGPSYDLNSKGQFNQTNPWFPVPPRKFVLFSGATTESDIEYRVNRPPDSEILNQTSLGFWFRSQLTDRVTSTFTFLSKPDNQLLLAVGGGYSIAAQRGTAEIYPKVQKQNIYSGQLDFDLRPMKAQVTYAHIDYWSLYEDLDLTALRFRSQVDISAVKFEMPWSIFNFSTAYMYSTIWRLKNEGGPIPTLQRPLTPQLPLSEALKVGATVKLPFTFAETIESGLFYLWSQSNQVEQISYDLRAKWGNGLVLFTKIELMQAAELTLENANEISTSAINDYVEVGGLYEF